MKCSLCGYEFESEEGVKACGNCPMSGCDMIRCPNCGYEAIPEPGWIKSLKRRLKHDR